MHSWTRHVFYCTGGIYGEYRVASLGTGECGVYSFVSMTDRNHSYAKWLQGTSCLQQPEHGVLVASLMDASREEMPTGGGGGRDCLLSLFPEKLKLCLLLKSILHSALIKRTNYRKSCGLFLPLLSQEGMEMRNAGLSFCSSGKAVHALARYFLSVSVLWELSLWFSSPTCLPLEIKIPPYCCLVLDCSLLTRSPVPVSRATEKAASTQCLWYTSW